MDSLISGRRLWIVLLALIVGWSNQALYATRAAGIGVTLLAEGDDQFRRPLDATPSPDATHIYFVARTHRGTPAVFRVPANGGPVEQVVKGAPLVGPRGLVFATNGQTLYVADPSARQNGAVFAVSTSNSSIQMVPGTRGLQPRALDLIRQGSNDVLYIAGIERHTRRAGIWRLVLDGTTSVPTPIAYDTFITLADGLAVTTNGDIFVAGRSGHNGKADVVIRIHNQTIQRVIEGVELGSPAGLALTLDQSTLLASAHAADGSSQVVLLDLATGKTSTFNDVIGANRNSGGLHRAQHANVFAWADVLRPGRVYKVEP